MKTNIICALTLFALASITRAVNPPPDGGYPRGNTAEGDNALFSLTHGGEFNTAIGADALYSTKSGKANTAIGYQSLYSNTTVGGNIGHFNTATGYQSLYGNTIGSANTANGASTLVFNTTGVANTAMGAGALYENNTGSENTAIGNDALFFNYSGLRNTATGLAALYFNRTGSGNTATGMDALEHNSTGGDNTAAGNFALYRNITGSDNIALGANAGINLTSGDHNIDIGNRGLKDEAKTIRIGSIRIHNRAFMAGIHGTTTEVVDAVPVVIDSEGQLGTVSSSARFKDEIKPMDKASETILGLKPVTFHYKSDHTGTAQFGLIAEEVAKANPDLVVRDEKGEIYTVRYDAVNAMLLNEFLKEHRKVEEQGATIAQQQKDFESTIAQQQKQIEALTASVQKVSNQLEVSKAGAQIVVNNQ